MLFFAPSRVLASGAVAPHLLLQLLLLLLLLLLPPLLQASSHARFFLRRLAALGAGWKPRHGSTSTRAVTTTTFLKHLSRHRAISNSCNPALLKTGFRPPGEVAPSLV